MALGMDSGRAAVGEGRSIRSQPKAVTLLLTDRLSVRGSHNRSWGSVNLLEQLTGLGKPMSLRGCPLVTKAIPETNQRPDEQTHGVGSQPKHSVLLEFGPVGKACGSLLLPLVYLLLGFL